MNRSGAPRDRRYDETSSTTTAAFQAGSAGRMCKRERPETAAGPAIAHASDSRRAARGRVRERRSACVTPGSSRRLVLQAWGVPWAA
jgi:hypothetical protein